MFAAAEYYYGVSRSSTESRRSVSRVPEERPGADHCHSGQIYHNIHIILFVLNASSAVGVGCGVNNISFGSYVTGLTGYEM